MLYTYPAAMGAVLARRGVAVPYPRPLRSGESMKSVRVLFAVVGLSALPLVAVAAQGHGNSPVACRVTPQTAGNSGNLPPGQAKKCPAPPPPAAPVPPPPPESPPTGPHQARGIVFEDIDGDGLRDPFAGEMGLAGWSVQLIWNGQVVASAPTDVDGNYRIDNIGNSSYSVCIVPQAGYNQTKPAGAAASGCGGSGYSFTLNSVFMTWFQGD